LGLFIYFVAVMDAVKAAFMGLAQGFL